VNACDYYKPIEDSVRISCPNSRNWTGKRERCSLKDKVVRNYKTGLVNEAVMVPRQRGVMGVFK